MTHNYEFRNASGRVCCSTDNIAELCTDCKVRFAERCAILAETPEQTSRRLTRENVERGYPRAAMGDTGELRAATHQPAHTPRTDVEWLRAYGGVRVAPPSGYAGVMKTADAHCPCNSPGYEPYGEPPNSYAIALALRAAQQQDREVTR